MKKEEFYQKYANTPLNNRFSILSNASNDLLFGMTLNSVYKEIKAIDDKTRCDLIRKGKLLREVEKFLPPKHLTKGRGENKLKR